MARLAGDVTSHVRPQLLGRMTQRAVVEALAAAGPLSRMDIARRTGISATTVSSAVALLTEAGFVEDDQRAVVGPGRPRQLLRLASSSQVIGLSVEPESCELVAGGLDGQPKPDRYVRFSTPDTYQELLSSVEHHAGVWIAEHKGRTLGLGISLPGVIDPTGERAVFSPNLHQTDDHRPAADLSANLKVPVTAAHDLDALCLVERRRRGGRDLAVIDFGRGLGVGVLVGGRPLTRRHGLPMELGHITVSPNGLLCGCGNRGCVETLATDVAFASRVSNRVGKSMTIDDALRFARRNPAKVVEDVAAVLDALSLTVSAVMNLFAPPLIALHGQLLDLTPDLVKQLHIKTAARCLPPFRDSLVLDRAQCTKAHGAMAAVLEQLFESLGPLDPVG